ncbi:hypothetical protein GW950_00715 [Candidatus Wolfebacteria bacterium]|nr:hypothetical protein [Candidatus Wolfebacteria bacterium]
MLKDHNHDLVKQLSEISSTLWRIKDYKKGSEECVECTKLWNNVEEKMEELSKMLTEEIVKHSKDGKFE